MGIDLKFEITLSSDYHVGAGHGDGVVDTLLLRDADGWPVIRGTTVVGLLRDGLYQLLQHGPLREHARQCHASGLPVEEETPQAPRFCGQFGTHAEEPCPVCRIFGTPTHPKRWRFSSARPSEQERTANPNPAQETPGGHVVQRARVSPRSRRVEPHKLFSQELGDAALTFTFTARNADDDPQALADAALLVAAARAVRGLGQARRRGRGACVLHLQDQDVENRWLESFKAYWLEGEEVEEWPLERAVPDSVVPETAHEGNTHPRTLRVIARAEEPLVLSVRREAGNEFESARFIPGSALLGALANRAARRYDLEEPEARQAFVELFLRGRVRFSPLLPTKEQAEDLQPAIPVPLDFHTCKAFPGFRKDDERTQHKVMRYATLEELQSSCPECKEEFEEEVPLKALKGFVTLSPNPHTLRSSKRHEMHIAVDPRTGRVREGDLYGYVSLDAGQYFVGEIVCSDETACAALQAIAALPDFEQAEAITLRVGRAAHRGHGKLRVVIAAPQPGDAEDPWRVLPIKGRVPVPPEVQVSPKTLVMTLLTDTIVPAPGGGYWQGFDETWLGKLLREDVEIVHAFARARNVDGFFGHLGLPRFRDVALTAGSTVRVHFKNGISEELRAKLENLEREGIGLRRNEGYGQVVFNHPLYAPEDYEELELNLLAIPPSLLPGTGNKGRVARSASFHENWESTLNAKALKGTWEDENFSAVARLIQQGAAGPLVELERALRDDGMKSRLGDVERGRFGQPETLLGEELKGPRSEKKHVSQTRKGREHIVALLVQLQENLEEYREKERSTLQRIALELLADRVGRGAAKARAKKQREKRNEGTQEEAQ